MKKIFCGLLGSMVLTIFFSGVAQCQVMQGPYTGSGDGASQISVAHPNGRGVAAGYTLGLDGEIAHRNSPLITVMPEWLCVVKMDTEKIYVTYYMNENGIVVAVTVPKIVTSYVLVACP